MHVLAPLTLTAASVVVTEAAEAEEEEEEAALPPVVAPVSPPLGPSRSWRAGRRYLSWCGGGWGGAEAGE